MPENQENAVGLKLPTFWNDQPEVWFAQAEAQFNLRNITADDTKYHYVVAALDQATAKRLIDLLKAPPGNDKYTAIKARLTRTFGLAEYERSNRLLDMPELGDDKPSVLMDNMLALLDDHEPCFLFRGVFLRRLPEDIRGPLIDSKEKDCRKLAAKADNLWLARQQASTNTVAKSAPSSKSSSASSSKSSSALKKSDTGLCFYHRKFGADAQKCQHPCSYKPPGNEQAGRQ